MSTKEWDIPVDWAEIIAQDEERREEKPQGGRLSKEEQKIHDLHKKVIEIKESFEFIRRAEFVVADRQEKPRNPSGGLFRGLLGKLIPGGGGAVADFLGENIEETLEEALKVTVPIAIGMGGWYVAESQFEQVPPVLHTSVKILQIILTLLETTILALIKLAGLIPDTQAAVQDKLKEAAGQPLPDEIVEEGGIQLFRLIASLIKKTTGIDIPPERLEKREAALRGFLEFAQSNGLRGDLRPMVEVVIETASETGDRPTESIFGPIFFLVGGLRKLLLKQYIGTGGGW